MTPHCRHCQIDIARREYSRGLCHACWHDLSVRLLYPCRLAQEGRELILRSDNHPLDPNGPTDATPGSPEKMSVMRDRAARGCQVFHPLDAGHDMSDLDLPLRLLRSFGVGRS